jgi:hypothetical protein
MAEKHETINWIILLIGILALLGGTYLAYVTWHTPEWKMFAIFPAVFGILLFLSGLQAIPAVRNYNPNK